MQSNTVVLKFCRKKNECFIISTKTTFKNVEVQNFRDILKVTGFLIDIIDTRKNVGL